MNNVDNLFNELKTTLLSYLNEIGKVEKAYIKAKELHKEQKRKDGEPYIIHPLEVAIILAKLKFDEDVICAGLLHDTVEDCGYTLSELKNDFGVEVAEMVDSVSAIDREKYIYDDSEVFEDENFVKFSAKEQTFKKLIAIGKKHPLGFYIKFADRLHNLSTISIFSYNKQVEKVRETQRWILPLTQILGSNFFYKSIYNECFKILNKKSSNFFENYNVYQNANKKNIPPLETYLKENFANTVFQDIFIERIREFQVYNEIKSLIPQISMDKISQGQIIKASNYRIYMINSKTVDLTGAVKEFMNIYNKKLCLDFDLIDVKEDNNRIVFKVKDKINNIYDICISSFEQYIKNRIGSMEGQAVDEIDDENTHQIVTSFIKVKTRSGELKFLPENSTVLDFAFKIHKDIGYGFKYAIINNFPTHYPPYTVLHNGDQVEIFNEKDENNEIIKCAEIKWFAYVETDLAKKSLIKYFEKSKNNMY